MGLNRNGVVAVLGLCGVACGSDDGRTDDVEPTATSALVAQSDVALVDPKADLSASWDWDDWEDWNGWNGWNNRGSRPSTDTAPGGTAWDPASVSRWCSLLEERQAEFLCKVTVAECQKPGDTFTQVLCQVLGLGRGSNTPTTPAAPTPTRPSDDDAWSDGSDDDAWGSDDAWSGGSNGTPPTQPGSSGRGSTPSNDDALTGRGTPGLGG